MAQCQSCRELIALTRISASERHEKSAYHFDKPLERAAYSIDGLHWADGQLKLCARFRERTMSDQEYGRLTQALPAWTWVLAATYFASGQEVTPDAYRSEELALIEVKVLWRSAYFLADDIPPTKVLESLDNLWWQAGLTSTPQKYFE